MEKFTCALMVQEGEWRYPSIPNSYKDAQMINEIKKLREVYPKLYFTINSPLFLNYIEKINK